MVDNEIFYGFQLNTTESVIVGRDREEVLEKLQRGFESIQYILQVKETRYQDFRLWNFAGMEKIAKACYIRYINNFHTLYWQYLFYFL